MAVIDVCFLERCGTRYECCDGTHAARQRRTWRHYCQYILHRRYNLNLPLLPV